RLVLARARSVCRSGGPIGFPLWRKGYRSATPVGGPIVVGGGFFDRSARSAISKWWWRTYLILNRSAIGGPIGGPISESLFRELPDEPSTASAAGQVVDEVFFLEVGSGPFDGALGEPFFFEFGGEFFGAEGFFGEECEDHVSGDLPVCAVVVSLVGEDVFDASAGFFAEDE